MTQVPEKWLLEIGIYKGRLNDPWSSNKNTQTFFSAADAINLTLPHRFSF